MHQKGFTLVEIAIVLVIIGLLLGGILKGQSLIEAARVKRVMSAINEYTAAFNGFSEKYDALPGDNPRATQNLPGCTADNFCVNGNGNRRIGAAAPNYSRNNQAGIDALPQVETTMFWKHLLLGDFITGVTANANPLQPAWGQTHPVSPLGNSGFHVADVQELAGANSASGHFLILRQPVTGDPHPNGPGDGALSPFVASEIDVKTDNGLASGGFVRSDDAAGTCSNPATGVYNTSTDDRNCLTMFRFSN